jgi:flagellar biosynthesis/type III secretory pathway protein FliH
MNTTNDSMSGRVEVVNTPNDAANGRGAVVNITDDTANDGPRQRTLTTADLAASANGHEREAEERAALRDDDAVTGARTQKEAEELAPLFDEQIAGDFRSRWSVVQQGFVDDPQKAVREGDELVAQVIKSLAETFAKQRATLEGQRDSTEGLRLALRRYRSFFERLLTI